MERNTPRWEVTQAGCAHREMAQGQSCYQATLLLLKSDKSLHLKPPNFSFDFRYCK